MKKSLFRFAVAAGLTLLLTGAPATLALDDRPEKPGTDSPTFTLPSDGAVDIVFEDRPRDGRREKPRPKQRDTGRQNMNGLESACVDAGFLGDLFGGFTGIVFTCPRDHESRPARGR